MADNQVDVKIVGDASGVAPATDQAKASVEGLDATLQQLTAGFAELAALMKESMAQGAASTAEMAAEMKVLEAETEKESFSLKELAASAKEGAEVLVEMREAIMGFAEVLLAAFAVEAIVDFAKEMGEAAEKVKHLSEQFGLTVPQVQQLEGVAKATGISIDALTKGLGILDKNMVTAANGTGAAALAFQAVGISANDGRSQMEKLSVIADKFKDMADGPKKVALAMELFGRSGRELIPVLNLGAAGLEEINAKTAEYGAANADAIEKGVALAESVNESNIAMQGISNVMTDALAPVLKGMVDGFNELAKAFIESYNSGGLAAQALAIVAGAAEVLGAALDAIGAILSELWDVFLTICSAIGQIVGVTFSKDAPSALEVTKMVFNDVIDVIVIFKDLTIIACELVAGTIREMATYIDAAMKTVEQAFHFDWAGIEATWATAAKQIADDQVREANRITAAWKEAAAAAIAGDQGKNVNDTGKKTGIKSGEGGKSFDPDLTKAPKAKKEKSEHDDTVSKLQEELDAKKTAWDAEQVAQDQAQAYSLQSEANFWDEALKKAGLSQEAKQSILAKSVEAHQKIIAQQLADEQKSYADQLAAAGKNTDAKMAIATQELAFVAQKFGEQSTQYKKAQDEIVKIKREAQQQIQQISVIQSQSEIKAAQDAVAQNERAAKFRVQLGIETNAQAFAQELQFLAQKKAIDDAALANEIAVAAQDPVRLAAINAQKLNLDRQYQAQKTQIEQQATLQRNQIELTGIKAISQSWAQSIAQMVTLQQSFASSIKSMWQSIVGAITNMLVQMLEQYLAKFIVTEAVKLGILKTSQVATVAGEVAKFCVSGRRM
jgi:hypothetical protein